MATCIGAVEAGAEGDEAISSEPIAMDLKATNSVRRSGTEARIGGKAVLCLAHLRNEKRVPTDWRIHVPLLG